MQDETLLHRLPFLALYSLSQSRCLLFTYSCWELDFGMEEVKRICQIIPVTSKVSFPGDSSWIGFNRILGSGLLGWLMMD